MTKYNTYANIRTSSQLERKLTGWHIDKYPLEPYEGRKEAIMAKKTAIHRSNPNANVAKRSYFLAWAEKNPEEAWKQAQEEQKDKPWQMQALRSDEGEAARAAIRATYLTPLIEAQAKLASFPKPSPAKVVARNELEEARKRYSEVEKTLRPRPRRRR